MPAEDLTPAILYFVRGRGRGHALAAMAITAHLPVAVAVRFVSYGTGAETLRAQGHAVLDLNLPDQPEVFAVERRLPDAFAGPPPALVVAHEEFDVLLAARQLRLPCLFLTDWFTPDPKSWWMQSLKHAEQILFLDDERVFAAGVYALPTFLAGRVHCTGPVLRPLRYTRAQRVLARCEADLPQQALVAAVFVRPGRRSEAVAPLEELLREAFDLLSAQPKLLLWERDADSEFDRVMAATDLAITKGNRNLVLELAALGVPTVSISHGLNMIDDLRSAALGNNRTLPYAGLTAKTFAGAMRERLAEDQRGGISPVQFENGAQAAASFLAARLLGGRATL